MTKEYTVLHLFAGIGGAAIGFQQACEEYRGLAGRFRTLAGIDCNREACEDFRALTGAPAVEMDLFTWSDYEAFHGHEPPAGWREATPEDLREATGYEYPDVIFTSPPCKGFSGLLPAKSAKSEKYQALNRLTVRGIKLALEAYHDDLPAIILIENVPRIASRGEFLLRQIKSLLGHYGYLIHEGYHDCGELGGLAQHRRRYLLIARNPEKMSAFVYRPPLRKVKAIGEVLGKLPMPDDPAGGHMHRSPRLQFKTWMRLALIPAGGDWRDLKKIAPEEYRLEYVPRGGGSFGVQEWVQPGVTVIGNASIKGSNAAAVADPRVPNKENRHRSHFRVVPFTEPVHCVTGSTHVANGAACIADPRLGHQPREGVFRILKWDGPNTTVTGCAKVGMSNGAACVADPRLSDRGTRHPMVYQVVRWEEPGPCVTGTRFGSGAPAIADPRLGHKSRPILYGVADWEKPISTVIGTASVSSSNGVAAVADPRLGCKCRNGLYGVQAWDQPANTVTGARNLHSGTAAVADPRIPSDTEQGVWLIISEDGTWHRPLTTWELAALQGFPLTMPDGRPLTLAGKSDARYRERIGNAVPPPTARSMAEQILTALLVSEKKDGWALGATGVWVVNDDQGKQDRGLPMPAAPYGLPV